MIELLLVTCLPCCRDLYKDIFLTCKATRRSLTHVDSYRRLCRSLLGSWRAAALFKEEEEDSSALVSCVHSWEHCSPDTWIFFLNLSLTAYMIMTTGLAHFLDFLKNRMEMTQLCLLGDGNAWLIRALEWFEKGRLLQGLSTIEWQLGNRSVFMSSVVLSKRVCELRKHHLIMLLLTLPNTFLNLLSVRHIC